jgi:cobalt-precorrin-7 (C5)-methyltransferase
MAMNPGRIAIVGCGPGSAQYLTEAARQAVAGAEVLVGSRRLLELFADHGGQRIVVGSEIAAVVDAVDQKHAAGRTVAVLVSGDPGLYSLAARIVERFGRERCAVVAGISSVQVAFARLGLDWADARIASAHAQLPEIAAEELLRLDKIAILGGTREGLRWSAQAAGVVEASHAAFLCENLTLADERIRSLSPEELASTDASSLAIVLLIRRSLLA